MPHWKAIRYRLEELGSRMLASTIPPLPRLVCVRLASVLGELAYRIDRRGRAVAFANLECVFGEEFTPRELREMARGS